MIVLVGLGTLVNVGAIVIGGILGMYSGKLLKERYQETIIKTIGFAVIFMGAGSVMANMLKVSITETGDGYTAGLDTGGIIMMVISLALGALLGEIIDLEGKFDSFGAWLKEKSGSSNDSKFIDAFVTSTLTVCVGAMAIIGSLEDGISGDHTTLFAKALLDAIIIFIMSASMGKGCIFSAIPVAIWQGIFTLFAFVIGSVLPSEAIANISYVGNILIACVGVNLVWPKTIRVANVLPSLIFAVIFTFSPV